MAAAANRPQSLLPRTWRGAGRNAGGGNFRSMARRRASALTAGEGAESHSSQKGEAEPAGHQKRAATQ